MADKAISALNAAVSVDAADVLPLVQNGETKKLPIGTLFDFIPNAQFIGNVRIDGTTDEVTSGAIDPDAIVTEVSNNTGILVTLTLADATDNGTLKIVTHGTLTANVQINVTNGNGFSSLVISSGKSALLFFNNGKWNNLSF